MSRPTIAFVSQPFDGVLPPHQNSIGIYIHEISQRLSDQFDVHVITEARTGQPQPRRVADVTYHHLSLRPDYYFGLLAKYFRRGGESSAFDHTFYHHIYVWQAARVLRQLKCQLAHVFNFSQFGPVLQRFNPNVKLTLQMRCEWLNQLDRNWLLRNLRSFDSVIGCSNHITRLAAARFPELTTQFATIYNGIDTSRFEYQPGIAANSGKQILFVGRISPEKGVHTLLEAFALAYREEPDLRLCLVGGRNQLPASMLIDLSDDPLLGDLRRFYSTGMANEYWEFLQSFIRENQLESVVTMPGHLAYEQVVQYFRSSTLLANPSLSESFGRGPAEACAIGLPVVATNIGGLSEIIVDGETGLLVEPEQPQALSEAMLRMINDQTFRQRTSAAAHSRMQDLFSWQAIGQRVAAHCHAQLSEEQP